MTKPAEAGLSPQEQLAKPAGQGVSRAYTITHSNAKFNAFNASLTPP